MAKAQGNIGEDVQFYVRVNPEYIAPMVGEISDKWADPDGTKWFGVVTEKGDYYEVTEIFEPDVNILFG